MRGLFAHQESHISRGYTVINWPEDIFQSPDSQLLLQLEGGIWLIKSEDLVFRSGHDKNRLTIVDIF
jgi:hypothetical protein